MANRFPLGQLTTTPGVLESFAPEEYMTCLARHKAGDWGDVTLGDGRANNSAVDHEGRILSAYKFQDGRRLWIITEADRSVTTLLLPEEY